MTREEYEKVRTKIGKSRMIYEHLEVLQMIKYAKQDYLAGHYIFDFFCILFFVYGYRKGKEAKKRKIKTYRTITS